MIARIMFHALFTDTMAGVPMWPIKEFPDQTICLSLRQAENLFRELKKAVGYIGGRIEHLSQVWIGFYIK